MFSSKNNTVIVTFVEDNATMISILYFEKSCKAFCEKPKEVDPINLNFCTTNRCIDSTQIYYLYIDWFLPCSLTHSHTMTPFDAPGIQAF